MLPNGLAHHIAEPDLALFVSGDVSLWRYAAVCLHIARCETCRSRIEVYRQSRQSLKHAAAEMPAGVNWDRLAAEMTANIRVGLAAGECVAPRRRKPVSFIGWKPAAVATGIVAVLSAAWWLNLPSSDSEALARTMHRLVAGGLPTVPFIENRGPDQGAPGQEAPSQGAVVQVST